MFVSEEKKNHQSKDEEQDAQAQNKIRDMNKLIKP
jgi:hypothetical protein